MLAYSAGDVVRLQRYVGNRSVVRLLRTAQPALQRMTTEEFASFLDRRNSLREKRGKPALTAEQFRAKLGIESEAQVSDVVTFSETYGHEADEIEDEDVLQWFELENGHYIYVVTVEGKLRFSKDTIGHVATASHTSGTGTQAAQILAAGEVLVRGGKIVWVDNDSGHYVPAGASQKRIALVSFHRKGWNVASVYHDVTSTKCDVCGVDHRAQVSGKMDKDTKLAIAQRVNQGVDLEVK